ncbi:MAG: hypothetical protein SH847_05360 [Roseiflexaceae bacterium]|nr:hypothetical protein [Roseiflexaceae bacterium]
MQRRACAGILFVAGLCLVLLFGCGLGFGFVQANVLAAPRVTFSVGPLAISAAPIRDQECRPIWEPCALNRMRPNEHSAYTIWFVYQTGPLSHQFRHYSLHIPLRQN